MKLHRLDLRHFRVHKSTTVHFEDGLTAIVGQNESGKSSILEALTWALYGGPAVRGSVKGLRWRNAPARKVATVEVHLSLGDTDYIVKRTETNARAYSRRSGTDDEWQQVADGTSGVTEYMAARVGMSLPEFSATYLCSQKDVARLAAMKPEGRRTFIRRIMGAERLDTAVKAARRTALDTANHLAGVQSTLGDREELEGVVTLAETEHEHRTSTLEACRADRDVVQHSLEEHDRELRQFDDMARQQAAAREKLDQIRSWINVRRDSRRMACQARDRAETLVTEWRTLGDDLQDFDTITFMLASFDKTAELVRNLEKVRDNLQRTNENIVEIGSEQERNRSVVDTFDQQAMDNAAAKVTETGDLVNRLADERRSRCAKIEGRLAQTSKERDTLTKAVGTGVCPTCGQPLKDKAETELAITRADAEIQAATYELQEAELATEEEQLAIAAHRTARDAAHQISLARARKTDAEARLARLDRQMAEAEGRRGKLVEKLVEKLATTPAGVGDYDPVRHERVREKHRGLEQKKARRDAIQTCGEDFERAIARIEELDGHLSKLAVDQLEAETALENVVYDANHHEAVKQLRGEDAARLRLCNEQVMAAEKRVAVIDRDLAAARQRLTDHDEREKKAKAVRRDLAFHETVRDRLQDFRGSVLDTVKPDLAELVSGMLAHLTDGRHESVALDDSFGIVVHEDGMESPVVSGGTEDVAALAMRIALSQMIAERSGHPLSLLVLDEPFGSLDAERRANVLQLLDSLRDVFSQVVMISHVEETREAADRTVELLYDPTRGCSRVA